MPPSGPVSRPAALLVLTTGWPTLRGLATRIDAPAQILRDRRGASAQGYRVINDVQSPVAAGAGFYDGHRTFQGEASLVSKRNRALSDLTVIDVVGAEPRLASYLTHLDRARLVIRDRVSGDALFTFRWASGYVNGPDVRIQGVLDHA